MRIDHFAYQRATRVASIGLMIQVAMGIILLLFGLRADPSGDTAVLFGSLYLVCGPLVWLSLIIVFHQHKLERLEALEQDELAAGREGSSSIFEGGDEARVAARRLRIMHQWMMPAVSLFVALLLTVLGLAMFARMRLQGAAGDAAIAAPEFARTDALGWAVAICLALAAISFIFSRFVAGMSQQRVWQNLRGGAGYMVGNALVLAAIATGMVFRFFENGAVVEGVAWGIPVFMFLLAAEVVFNLILGFYRPRIPGETPRPAFDSKILSIMAAPDSLVRTINEAVNYQFGFDVTSTWGYQLLMRSVARLLVLGIAVLLVMSTVVYVEPHERAVKLTGGRISGDVAHSGLMWKLPWPLQSASVESVSRIRSLPLTATVDRGRGVLWSTSLSGKTDREIEPFIVRRGEFEFANRFDDDPPEAATTAPPDEPADEVSRSYALIDAEVILRYRVREDDAGFLEHLAFAPATGAARGSVPVRDRILRALALREVSLHFSTLTLDQALSSRRLDLTRAMADRVQRSFDEHRAGVEVVSVDVPMIRPAGDAATEFEDLMMAMQDAGTAAARAEATQVRTLTYLVGNLERSDEVLAEIRRYNQLRDAHGIDAPEVIEQQDRVVKILLDSGGTAGQDIANADTDRWLDILEAQAHASRVAGQLAVYRAAPDLYRQRETMRVLALLDDPTKRKYVLAVNPGAVHLDVAFREPDPFVTQFNQPSAEGTP